MSHQKDFYITAATAAEMFTVRAVLKELGYTIYPHFERSSLKDMMSNATMRFTGVRAGDGPNGACRTDGRYFGQNKPVTLAQFIEQQFAPVKTPQQVELEKLEASVEALNKQIAALKATI